MFDPIQILPRIPIEVFILYKLDPKFVVKLCTYFLRQQNTRSMSIFMNLSFFLTTISIPRFKVIFPTCDFLYGLWFVNFYLFFKRTLKLIRKILNNDYSKIHADFISLIRHIYKNTSLHEHLLIIIIVSTRKKQLSQFNYFMHYTLAYTMVIKVTSYNIWKV